MGRKYKPLLYVGSAEEEREFKQQGFAMRHREADKTSTCSATLHQSKTNKTHFLPRPTFSSCRQHSMSSFPGYYCRLKRLLLLPRGKGYGRIFLRNMFADKHQAHKNHTARSASLFPKRALSTPSVMAPSNIATHHRC